MWFTSTTSNNINFVPVILELETHLILKSKLYQPISSLHPWLQCYQHFNNHHYPTYRWLDLHLYPHLLYYCTSGWMSDIHSGGTTFDFRTWHVGETWPRSSCLFIFGRISRPDRFQICSLITSMVVRCKWDTELCTGNMVPQVFVQTTWNSYNRGGGNTHFLNSLWTSGQNILPRHWGFPLSLGIDLGPRHYQHHTLTIWGSRPTGSGLKHLQEKPPNIFVYYIQFYLPYLLNLI